MRLKVANGENMDGASHEAELGSESLGHDGLDRPDKAKRLMPKEKLHKADLPDWDIQMGYDFMVSNSAGALPECTTVHGEANDSLSWLLTHYTPGGSQQTRDEEQKLIRVVKAAGIKSNGSNGEHLQEYGLSCEAYQRMMEASCMETPLTDVFASQEAPQLRKCARYWQKPDSACDKHWGKHWGHLYVHESQWDSERIVNKVIHDRAKRILVLTGLVLNRRPWQSSEIQDRFHRLGQICACAR